MEEKARAREARLAAERAAEQAALTRRRLWMFGAIVAVAAVVLAAAVLISQSGTEPESTPDTRIAVLDGVPQNGTRLGAPAAPVVVEEYADMQCPFCARFATDDLPSIVTDYVRPGRVQLDFKVLTFLGADSVRAGRFVMAAAAQDRLWQATEAFFADQGRENSGYVTQDLLRDVAGKAGLDADRAFADQAKRDVTAGLGEARDAAQRAGVDSTPAFVVRRRGGEPEVVASDGLRAAIDAALEQ